MTTTTAGQTEPPLPPDRQDKDYDVGHGRPPMATRWRAGQSGNRRGRPKAKLTAPQLLERILAEKVAVTINGERQRISRDEARLRALPQKALKGDLAAARDINRRAEGLGASTPIVELDHSLLRAKLGIVPQEQPNEPA